MIHDNLILKVPIWKRMTNPALLSLIKKREFVTFPKKNMFQGHIVCRGKFISSGLQQKSPCKCPILLRLQGVLFRLPESKSTEHNEAYV